MMHDDHDPEWWSSSRLIFMIFLWYFYDIHDHDNDFAGYDDNYDVHEWSRMNDI